VKATDENQTSENWEVILNLCDKVVDEEQEGSVSSLSCQGSTVPWGQLMTVTLSMLTLDTQIAQCCGSSHQASRAPERQRTAVCSYSSRSTGQELHDRLASGDIVQGIHPGFG
jgi:hypothetical protein